ncbi:hypothetical protein TNCV_4344322 [Trichonephila clavipes]|nr:hypothetical protein TNCV_4344322 [Trichonephila clavipes]
MQISVERIRTTYPKQTLLSKLLKQKTHKVSTLEHRGRQRLWCTERQSWVQELPYVVLSGEFGSESIILMAIYMSGGSEETARHLPVFDICIGALHLDAERLAYHSCPATTGDEVGHKLEATWNALLVSAIQGQIDYMPNRTLVGCHDLFYQEYQSQADTEGIFYMSHHRMTCESTIFSSRKCIDSSRDRTRYLRLTKWARCL